MPPRSTAHFLKKGTLHSGPSADKIAQSWATFKPPTPIDFAGGLRPNGPPNCRNVIILPGPILEGARDVGVCPVQLTCPIGFCSFSPAAETKRHFLKNFVCSVHCGGGGCFLFYSAFLGWVGSTRKAPSNPNRWFGIWWVWWGWRVF